MTRIAMCGAGALGSMIALGLARSDREFLIIDDDRVAEENLATSAYFRHHVGMYKASSLAEMLWNKAKCECLLAMRTMTDTRALDQFSPDLVIDTFDNAESRNLVSQYKVQTVHVGVSDMTTGAVTWDRHWQPVTGPPRGDNPICTHELGAPILKLTAAVGCNVIERANLVSCVVILQNAGPKILW